MAEQTTSSIVIDAAAADIMAVIADFPAYPEWAKGVTTSDVVAEFPDGRAEQVFFKLDVSPIANFLHGSPATRFGKLEFRGGLQLSSSDPDFGSLSGLDVAPDGRTLYAIADNGFWFTATLAEEGGRLTGLGDALFGVVEAQEFDGDVESIVREYDPFAH